MSFFTELQRRNVVRVGVAYALIAWVIAQVAEFAFENFGAPDWVLKVVVVMLLLGLPVVLVFAWIYEMTPEGIRREKDVDRTSSITPQTGRRLDRAIIAVLVVALAFFAFDKYGRETPVPAEPGTVAGQQAELPVTGGAGVPDKSVAVLPFVAMSDGPDDEYFADGLTEEILNSLAQLPELLVTARTSAFMFKGDNLPAVPEIAARLGVRHVVEGSVRRSGERLRVTAQLIRADDGFHLWSENYDSTSADTIQVQEDIAEKIAVSLDVVLDEDKAEAMRKVGLRDIEAFMAYQKGLKLFADAHGDVETVSGLRAANKYFDEVVARVPNFPPVYGLRADYYVHLMDDFVVQGPATSISAEEVAAGYDKAIENYEAAVRYAEDRDARLYAELDLAFIEGNWRGLRSRAERVLAVDTCEDGSWDTTIINALGLAEAYLPKAERIVACDPLRSLSWFNLARSLLWAGNAEEAVRVAQKGMGVARGGWLEWVLVRALIETGRYEEAQDVIDTELSDPDFAGAARVLLAAKQGKREAADQALSELTFDPDTSFYGLMLYAWAGRQADANRLAARYDSVPWGRLSLWQMTHWCACGNPFDPDAAPNFARVIEESELPWPPQSGRVYPLKDW